MDLQERGEQLDLTSCTLVSRDTLERQDTLAPLEQRVEFFCYKNYHMHRYLSPTLKIFFHDMICMIWACILAEARKANNQGQRLRGEWGFCDGPRGGELLAPWQYMGLAESQPPHSFSVHCKHRTAHLILSLIHI